MINKQKLVLFFFVFINFIVHSISLKITKFHVPSTVILDKKNSELNNVNLTCNYRYIRIERGFALKWYFNHRLIYIWSPKSGDFDIPRAFHPFTDHINVNRSINGVLELRNITQDLSGHYQCIVMTYEAFESKQAHLQVIIPEDDFILERIISPRFVEYRCAVNNIYPNPILSLRWSSPVIFSVTKYGLQGENGLFDVSESIYTSNRNALEANVSCEIQILNTNYSKILVFDEMESNTIEVS
uniref:CSON012132 protein n=1 Tax=Culicoides sonorensis TaxID=179676 RepID=A0A336KJ32_CULSO